ncbi:hypothetical protein WA577_006221 [Blastocystis sp. JDR]
MAQQYPCLPSELRNSLSTVYPSKRDQVLAEKTLKERDSLSAALNALNCPEIIVSKFLCIIGSTPLSPQLLLAFSFSDVCEEVASLSSHDVLSLKSAIATSSLFQSKSLAPRRKIWFYIRATRNLKSSLWSVDGRFSFPLKRKGLLTKEFVIGEEGKVEENRCWYKCSVVMEGCPSLQ